MFCLSSLPCRPNAPNEPRAQSRESGTSASAPFGCWAAVVCDAFIRVRGGSLHAAPRIGRCLPRTFAGDRRSHASDSCRDEARSLWVARRGARSVDESLRPESPANSRALAPSPRPPDLRRRLCPSDEHAWSPEIDPPRPRRACRRVARQTEAAQITLPGRPACVARAPQHRPSRPRCPRG